MLLEGPFSPAAPIYVFVFYIVHLHLSFLACEFGYFLTHHCLACALSASCVIYYVCFMDCIRVGLRREQSHDRKKVRDKW
jgi:hypothetical protein